MELYYPSYYNDFHCIAADCPDSCCQEWTVDVDADAAAYYRSLTGSLGDRLRAVLSNADDGTVMEIKNGRCPMWQQDGLCRIHAELGHDALCETCRNFPRLQHDYGDFIELGLELSCPEAARLIFADTQGNMLRKTQPGGSAPEYSAELMVLLRSSRQTALDFLNTSTLSFGETLAVLLLYAHDVQAQIDGADSIPFDPQALLAEAKTYSKNGDVSLITDFFKNLEILTERWKDRLLNPTNSCLDSRLLPLTRYMFNRYWLQAVSDYDLVCRVKLTVVACLLLGALGGNPVQTAQLFSKEIENNPDNLEQILDGAYSSPAFTDVNLLSLLLG